AERADRLEGPDDALLVDDLVDKEGVVRHRALRDGEAAAQEDHRDPGQAGQGAGPGPRGALIGPGPDPVAGGGARGVEDGAHHFTSNSATMPPAKCGAPSSWPPIGMKQMAT